MCQDKANARLASVKSRKKRDIQRNVRDYNLLLLEDESEEEIYTEIAYIVLNAGGFDRDTEVELDTAVMETDEMAENFEDNFSDIKDDNNGVQSSSVSRNSYLRDFEEFNHEDERRGCGWRLIIKKSTGFLGFSFLRKTTAITRLSFENFAYSTWFRIFANNLPYA